MGNHDKQYIDSRATEGGRGLDDNKISSALRGVLQFAAATQVDAATLTNLVDNSGGTGGAGVIAMPIPAAAVDATGAADGAVATTFDGALDTVNDGCSVLLEAANEMRAVLGITALEEGDGAIAASGTVAAVTVVSGSASAGTTADWALSVAKMQRVANQVANTTRAVNRLRVAVGLATIADASGGSVNTAVEGGLAVVETPVVGVGAGAGTTACEDSAADAFLVAARTNLATLVDKLDDVQDVVPASVTINAVAAS